MSDKKYSQPFQRMASRKGKKGKQKRNEYRKSDKTEQVLRELEMMVSQFGLRRVHRVYGEVLRISISSYKHMDEIANALTQLQIRKDIEIESISFPSSGTVNNKRGFVIYTKTVNNRKSEHVLLVNGYHAHIVTTFPDPGVQTPASPTQLTKMKMESLKDLAREIPLPTRVAPTTPKTPLEPTSVPKKRWSDAVKEGHMSLKSKALRVQRMAQSTPNHDRHYKNSSYRKPNHFVEQVPVIDGNFALPPRNFYDYPYENMQREVIPFSEQAWRPQSPPKARLRFQEPIYPANQQVKDDLPSVQMPEKLIKQERKALPWRPSWKIARMQNEDMDSSRKAQKTPETPPGFEFVKKNKTKCGNRQLKQIRFNTSSPMKEPQPVENNVVEEVKQTESPICPSLSTKAVCTSTEKESEVKQSSDTSAIPISATDMSSECIVTGTTHTPETDEIERSRSCGGSNSDKNASSTGGSDLLASSTRAIASTKETLEIDHAEPVSVSPNADTATESHSYDNYLIISFLNMLMGFILLIVAYRNSGNDSRLQLEITAGLIVCAFSCFMIVVSW